MVAPVSSMSPLGMAASDKYVKIEEERRKRDRAEKGKKKEKKKREKRSRGDRRNESGPESEEDIRPAQTVDIVTEEMPEVPPWSSACESFLCDVLLDRIINAWLPPPRMPYPAMMRTEIPMTPTELWTLTWTSKFQQVLLVGWGGWSDLRISRVPQGLTAPPPTETELLLNDNQVEPIKAGAVNQTRRPQIKTEHS